MNHILKYITTINKRHKITKSLLECYDETGQKTIKLFLKYIENSMLEESKFIMYIYIYINYKHFIKLNCIWYINVYHM